MIRTRFPSIPAIKANSVEEADKIARRLFAQAENIYFNTPSMQCGAMDSWAADLGRWRKSCRK